MKQKVVIKVPMNGQKSRSKALKIAVGVHGVESAALAGQDKNQIEVVGDGIDSVALTTLLRKNVGFSELVSVGPVPEKKDGGDDQKKDVATVQIPLTGYYNYNYPPYAPPYGNPFFSFGVPILCVKSYKASSRISTTVSASVIGILTASDVYKFITFHKSVAFRTSPLPR